MLALLDLIPRWLLLAALVASGVFGGMQTIKLASARGDVLTAEKRAADLQLAVAVANTEAANKSAALSAAVTKAQNEAQKRETELRAAAAAAGAESDGLRNDLSSLRDQLAGLTEQARTERSAAIADVLGQCAQRYSDLAARCDRHVSDIQTLIEAWPQSKP
jgi:chromosome segregation ATPase